VCVCVEQQGAGNQFNDLYWSAGITVVERMGRAYICTWVAQLKEGDYSNDQVIGGRIILKLI